MSSLSHPQKWGSVYPLSWVVEERKPRHLVNFLIHLEVLLLLEIAAHSSFSNSPNLLRPKTLSFSCIRTELFLRWNITINFHLARMNTNALSNFNTSVHEGQANSNLEPLGCSHHLFFLLQQHLLPTLSA